jgi:hypothetical protein
MLAFCLKIYFFFRDFGSLGLELRKINDRYYIADQFIAPTQEKNGNVASFAKVFGGV